MEPGKGEWGGGVTSFPTGTPRIGWRQKELQSGAPDLPPPHSALHGRQTQHTRFRPLGIGGGIVFLSIVLEIRVECWGLDGWVELLC